MVSVGHFTFWISLFAERNRYMYSQASRSNYCIVGIYMSSYIYLFIIIILEQKGVMQTNKLAGV